LSALLVKDLCIRIGDTSPLRACSLQVSKGEVVGLVGESGSGKSLTALACMGLLPAHAQVSGLIQLGETSILGSSEAGLRSVRGRRLAMIFQNPMSALNPFFTIGWQLAQVISQHFQLSGSELQQRVLRALDKVQLAGFLKDTYPHQLSGGQLQRVMIAMAVACEPGILIADEPTTALDVTVQAKIIRLLHQLTRDGMGLLLISHDLALVSQVADRVHVMYAGRTVESGLTADLMDSPSHPYTANLLKAQPRFGQFQQRLPVIEGRVLPADQHPAGCVFQSRCGRSVEMCASQQPPTLCLRPKSAVECHQPILPTLQVREHLHG
jgi:oligopeptide/dipeptide ABC transporter ATP-binding protein